MEVIGVKGAILIYIYILVALCAWIFPKNHDIPRWLLGIAAIIFFPLIIFIAFITALSMCAYNGISWLLFRLSKTDKFKESAKRRV